MIDRPSFIFSEIVFAFAQPCDTTRALRLLQTCELRNSSVSKICTPGGLAGASHRTIESLISLLFVGGKGEWYARVPSDSNVADDPSRMLHLNLNEFPGARCVAPILPAGIVASRILK